MKVQFPSVGLRGQLVATMVLASLVFGATVLSFLNVMVHDALNRRTAESYLQMMEIIAPTVRDQVLTGQVFELQMYLTDTTARHGELVFLAVTDARGRLIASSLGSSIPDELEAFFSSEQARSEPDRLVILRDRDRSLLHRRIPIADLEIGHLHAGIDTAAMDALANEITTRLALLFVVLTVIGVAVAFMMGGFLTEPLRRMTAMARNIGAGDLTGRLPVRSTSEVGDLATAFNEMTAQLSASKQALSRSEKLAALGQLAAGVAHEINNPLASLRAILWALRKSDGNPEQQQRHLGSLDKGLRRIAETIEHLLNYARQRPVAKTPTSLADVARESVELVKPSASDSGVDIVLEHMSDLPEILFDPAQIQQVVVNLLLNSIHAMEGTGEDGTILVRLSSTGVEQLLEIEDEGPGISEEDMKKVFEPFYSTRPEGKGTGLGLAVSLSIAEAHGGTLDLVPSGKQRGLVASLRIPCG